MKFKNYFIIGIFLMLMLLCIACASAGDINDTTLKTGTDTIKSTDLNGAATDNSKAINADNEIIGVSSENDTKSKDNIIASSQGNDKLSDEPRTFTQFRSDILATTGDVFIMEYDYKYDATADRYLNLEYEWLRNRQISIIGNGHTIEGRGTTLELSNIISFDNIHFKNVYCYVTSTNSYFINITNCNFTGYDCSFSPQFCAYRLKYVIGCNFFNNRLLFQTKASGVTDLSIINCTFKNITLPESAMGIIGTTKNVKNCLFENITHKDRYAALIGRGTSSSSYYSADDMKIENCIFKNCVAAMMVNFFQYTKDRKASDIAGRMYVNNCSFINCNPTTSMLCAVNTGYVTSSYFKGAVVVTNSSFYLNKSVRLYYPTSDSYLTYCSAYNNTIVLWNYSLDSDVEKSEINFEYTGLPSLISTTRTNLVAPKFDDDQCFVLVNTTLPNNNQKFNLVVRDVNNSVVLTSSVFTDENGKGSFDCSSLDIGNYTYTIYHNDYNAILDSGLLTIEGYPELVINSITIGYGQKYYNITGAFKFASRTSGMASTLNLSTSSGIRLGSAVVNDDGTWTVTGINSTLLLPGIYDLHGDYAGNANYGNFSNTTGKLNVTIGNFEPLLYNVDIEFGDDKILNITLQNGAGETFSGFVINLTGKSINGILSKTTDADGKVSFNISDLAVGDYDWNISTTGIEGLYNPLNMSIGTFKVKRAYGWNITPYLNATVIVYGNNVSVIGGVINKHLASPTGTITFTDGLKSDSYTLTVDDKGNFKLTLVNVTSGLKNFTIQYSGDTNYSDMNYTILKEVDKYPITLNITSITPLDTTYPDTITVKGNILYPDYLPAPTGTLTLTLGDKTVTAVLDGGNFTATFVGVKPGNYTNITLSFTPQGNLNYTGSNNPVNISTVSIDKFLPSIIAVSNVIRSYPGIVNVIGTVTGINGQNPTGKIEIIYNNTVYAVYNLTTADNGAFNINVLNLPVGEYNLTVRYAGDDYYYNNTNTTNIFTVNPSGVKFNITIINGTYNMDGVSSRFIVNVTGVNGGKYPEGIVRITLSDGSRSWQATLSNGIANVGITSLDAGNYTNVKVEYIKAATEDHYLNNESTGHKFSIYKADPGLQVEAPTIGFGADGKIYIDIADDATGNVTVKIGLADTVTFELASGVRVYTIPKPNPGSYNITATYNGDKNYNSSVAKTTFFIERPNAFLHINSSNIQYGEVEIVNFTIFGDDTLAQIASNARGTITVYGINKNPHILNVVGGRASLSLSNLTIGEYDLFAVYSGDDELAGSYQVDSFNVTGADTGLIIITNSPINEGEDLLVDVYVNHSINDLIYLYLGDGMYAANMTEDGKFSFLIPNLKQGTYLLNASFKGNAKFNAVWNTTTVIVKKQINASVITNNSGDKLNITMPDNVTGNATVSFNGTNYTVGIVNGSALINLTNATPGEHNVTITYTDADGNNITTNITVTVPKWDSTIDLNVTNINEGDKEIIQVGVTPGATGHVLIQVNNLTYYVELKNSYAELVLDNLREGNYTVTATYAGDKYYKNSTISKMFKVTKLVVDVNTTGNSSSLDIKVPENTTGNATVNINGTNFTAEIINGTAKINLTNATPGTYNATITYTDENGTNITTNITITVPKWDSTIDLNVTNINVGDKEIIQVGVTPGATGHVFINVNNLTYYVELKNSYAELVLDNLREGNYTVTATYAGDKYYKNSTISKMFKVTKLVVDVNTTGNSSSLDIKVPGNTTGNATVNINGTNYTAEIVNGTAKINLTNATPGTYNATITYTDENGTNITTNITITVPKWDSTIDLNVTNINVGDKEIIQVGVTPGATGEVIIKVNDIKYLVDLVDSKAELILDNLREGNYTVTATYTGDKYYKNSTITKMFKVTKLIIDVNTTGNSSSMDIKVPENTTGNATVNINGTNFTAEIVNGTAKINLTNATPGTYNATITYTDENGTNITTNITITVPKWDSEIDLNVTNIYVGQTEVIQVSVTPGATGHVFITVDNLTYYKELIDSKTTLNIKGLDIGNYTVSVYYSGDDKYKNSTTSGWFNVSSTGININTTNSSDLNITVPANTTGNVTVIINGQNYTGTIVNGSAVVDLSNATPGTYNATVIYTDKDGNQVKTTMTMSVPKWNTPIDLNVTDIYYGSDETIIVNVTKGATGFVIIDVNGTVYYKELNDSKTSIVLENLKVGNYTVTATYLGDKYYNNATITKIFEVKTSGITVNNTENSTDLNITLPDNVTGNVTVILDGKNYTGTIINGSAVVDLSNATPGTYNATVIYTDKDGKQVNTSMIIAVPKWNSSVDLIVSDIRGGQRETIIINVTNGATGNVLIDVNGIIYYKELINSKTTLELDNLPKGSYTVRVTYMGDDKYNNSTNQDNFIVGEGIVLTVYLDGKKPMLDVAVPHDAVGDVTVRINGKDYTGTINNHHAILNISDITPGVYNATSTYKIGNGSSYVNNDTITVPEPTLLATVINVEHISRDVLVTSVLKDVNGTVLPFQYITYKLNGVIGNTTTDKDGLFTVQCVQNSTLYIEYAGNNVYEGCNATIVLDKFLDIRNATQIISEEYTTYAIDFALGERGGYFKFQIKDENGKALANKPVQIGFCGVVYNRVTDSEGYAQLQINLNTPFIFTFAIAFLGDETHNASFVVQQINVNKKTTTLQANAKTFKASAKTKTYTVTLKSDVCSSIDGKSYMGAGKKITMKVNGKTYTANTKANGQATFKLDLTKKGTYTASISFDGDQRYDASKTTAKIKIN